MKQIIFWGATGQAVVLEELLSSHNLQLIGLFDNDPGVKSPFPGVPIYHGKSVFKRWASEQTQKPAFAIAIGGDKGLIRIQLGNDLEESGLYPINLFHPTSFIASSVKLGKGIQVLAQTAVSARVQLGDYVIVNTSASIDHECIIGNGVHIAPGAKLAGCVKVNDYAFIGTGAVIIPRIIIGEGAVIGAGSVVIKDIPPFSVAVGNPAKVVKKLQLTNYNSNNIHG